MYRNLLNRGRTGALACALGLALLLSAPAQGIAGSIATSPGGGLDPGAGPPPDPGASGDPDSPSNTGRPAYISIPSAPVAPTRQAPIVSHGMWNGRDVWMIKVRFALQMVRVFYLRD